MVKASSLLVLLLPALVLAADPVPDIHRPVTDTMGLLSEADTRGLDAELLRLRDETGVQLAVLLVDTTHGEPIEDYTLRAAEAWRGGAAGRSDGLLFTLALNDRRMRLEVGYGLEEYLPDDAVRRLLDAQRPLIRQARYRDAIQAVIDGVRERVADRVVEGGLPGAGTQRAPRLFVGKPGFLWLCGIGGLLGAVLAALWWRWARGVPTGFRVLLFATPLFGVPYLIARVTRGGPYPPFHHVWVVVLLCGLAFFATYLYLEASSIAGMLAGAVPVVGVLYTALFSDATRPLALLSSAFIAIVVLAVLAVFIWAMHYSEGSSGSYSSSSGSDWSSTSSSSSWWSSSSSSDSSWSSSSSSSDSSWSSSSSDSSWSSGSSSSDYSGGGGDFGGGGASSSW